MDALLLEPHQYDLLWAGTRLTLQLLFFSFILGVFLSLIFGVARLSEREWMRGAALVYVEFARGISSIILLFIIAIAVPILLGVDQESLVLLGSIALGINMGGYGAEIVRGAILSIPKGQTEASIALNLSPTQRLRHIILPQSMRIILPPMGNLTIEILKGTALVSLIGLGDILQQTNLISTQRLAARRRCGGAVHQRPGDLLRHRPDHQRHLPVRRDATEPAVRGAPRPVARQCRQRRDGGVGMSATTEEPTTKSAADQIDFQPHKRWYKKPEVLGPVLVAAAGYALLIFAVEERSFFRTRMTAEGTETFDWMFFYHLVPLMLRGLYVTAKATVLGFTVAAVLGFIMALGRRSQVKAISWPSAGLIEFIRSTPLLVQLFFAQALVRSTDVISLRPMSVLTITLGIHYATYCSEGYRAGINSVPAGQWEASTSLNLDPRTKWTRVIIPQAVPNVLPALGNFLVAAFKDAPLGFSIGVPGILAFATTVRGETFRPVEPYILVGIGFLMASLPAAWLVRRLEEKIAYERT